MKQNLTLLQTLETKIKHWFMERLPRNLSEAKNQHDKKTALEFDTLALFYVENASAVDFCDPMTLEMKVASDLREIWKPQSSEYIVSILENYDELSKLCIKELESLNIGLWKGQIDVPISKFKIEIDSWRKDLEDYIEQHQYFMEGFVAAKGIGYQLIRSIAKGYYNDLAVVKKSLSKELEFLYSGPNEAVIRWQGELQNQFDNSFLRIQRNIKATGSKIQTEHHRHILRLRSLL